MVFLPFRIHTSYVSRRMLLSRGHLSKRLLMKLSLRSMETTNG